MLYIVTALYEEALPFLKKYNLKRKPDFPHFDLFTGEEVLLLITHPGALRAATAVSSLLTAYPPGKQDLFLSAGCAGCAVKETLGKTFLLCRITEGSSLRTRYPELLYRCPFPIAEVITLPTVCTKAPIPDIGGFADSLPRLFDMEAAGIYEAAIPYFSCDRLLFIKVVSDALTGLSELSDADRRRRVTDCIENIIPILSEWLNQLTRALSSEEGSQKIAAFLSSSSLSYTKDILGTEGQIFFEETCKALRLSVASSQKLYQLMLYLTLSGIPYMDSMQKLLVIPLAKPCREKKEGLKYLEQLYQYYL